MDSLLYIFKDDMFPIVSEAESYSLCNQVSLIVKGQ